MTKEEKTQLSPVRLGLPCYGASSVESDADTWFEIENFHKEETSRLG